MEPITVDFNYNIPQPSLISVDTGEQPVIPVSEDVAARRTAKFSYGIAPVKSYDEVERAVLGGQEATFRAEVAGKLDADKKEKLVQLIQEVTKRKGGPLTPEETDLVVKAAAQTKETTEPGSVFESEYSKKYLDTLYGTTPATADTWFTKYLKQSDDAKRSLVIGKDYLTKSQILGTAIEDVEAQAKAEPYISRGANILGNLLTFGLAEEYKQRGNVPGVGFFEKGLLGGSNVEEQSTQLWRKSIPEFTRIVTQMKEMAKDDPHFALEFLRKMQGNFDKDTADIGSIATIVTAPGAGIFGKAVLRGAGILKPTPKTAAQFLESIGAESAEQIRIKYGFGKAVTDVLESTKSTLPVKEAAEVGVGNLPEAAVLRATANAENNFKGTSNPLKQTVEALHEIVQEAAVAAATNPGKGPGAQEATNRIVQGYQKLENSLINVIASFQRGSRIPAALADENGQRLMQQAIKDDYFGNSSRVVAVKGPLRLPHTNTLHYELQIGRHDAGLFSSYDHAAAVARLEGIVLQGEFNVIRQTQLEKLIAQAKYELGAARESSESPYGRALLDKLGSSFSPKLKALISEEEKQAGGIRKAAAAETKASKDLAKYQLELDDLKAKPGATIEQQGTHFYIRMYQPLDETGKVARSLLLSTPKSIPARGFFNSFFGWGRTPEETASRDAMDMAKIALYGQNNLLALAKAELADFQKLSRFTFPGTAKKQRWLDVEDTLKAARQNGFFQGVGDLEDHYWRTFNRAPHQQEIRAYFAAKRYSELTSVLNDLKVYTEESRIGAQTFTFRSKGPDGRPMSSSAVKGINRDKLPIGEENVLIMTGEQGGERIPVKFQPTKEMTEQFEQGRLRVIEVLHPNDKPLKGFGQNIGNNHVAYVVTDKAEVSPLQLTRTDRKGMGLWDMDYPLYLKQANMEYDYASKTWRYKGDKTIMPIANGAMGKDILKLMEEVRKNLKIAYEAIAKGVDYEPFLARARLAGSKLPMEWQEHQGWYNETKDASGKMTPPNLNVMEPIRLVPGDKLIADVDGELAARHGSQFRNDTRGNLILKNLIKDEKDTFDLYTIRNEGTRNNPLYKYEPAQYIDPIPSMQRSMGSIVNSTFMSDYRTYTIEHWMQEAKDANGVSWINASEKQLAHSPAYYFFHGEYRPGTPLDVISRLNDAKFKAEQIWGTPSRTDTWLHTVSQHMYDSAYEKGGLRGKLQLTPAWMLSKGVDSAKDILGFTYHAALGVFSIPQFIVQNMGYATILGIEGAGLAGAGTFGALLHQMSRLMPQHIDALDKIASKLSLPSIKPFDLLPGGSEFAPKMVGFKPGQFKEANQGLVSTGFHLIGSDHQFINGSLSPKVIQSGVSTVLDIGTTPFRAGERNLRFGAWYTAYLKYRAEHPTGAISDEGWREVFSRAELLSGNMSAASKSALQRGPLAFTTQFLGYSMRVAELLTGKRLETAERARMLTTYWSLFGVSALGRSGLPAGDIVRKWAVDAGYNENSDGWKQLGMEGLPSAALKWITGNRYNVGARYGDPAFSPMRDIMSGDKPTWALIGGATTSNLAQMLTAGDGFRKAVWSTMTDSDEFFPLTKDHFLQPAKSVASVNNFTRWIEALNSGDWLSKKGHVLEKGIGPWEATLMSISGLQRQTTTDVQTNFSITKDRKEQLKKVEDDYIHAGELWMRALSNNDPEQAKAYGQQMKYIIEKSGYPIELRPALAARLEAAKKSMADRSIFNLYLGKDVPMEKRPDQAKTFREIQGTK